MKVLPKLKHLTLLAGASIVLATSSTSAYACDECTQLSDANSYLSKILNSITVAFFGKVPGLADDMASMSALPPAKDTAYTDATTQVDMMRPYFTGQSDGTTIMTNYSDIFGDYLMNSDDTTFPGDYTEAGSYFLNPTSGYYYTSTEADNLQKYLTLVSGSAYLGMQQPSSKWISTSSSKSFSYQQDQASLRYLLQYIAFNHVTVI